MKTYIEPVTNKPHNYLPSLWNNISGVNESNCESLGWVIQITDDPIPEPVIPEPTLIKLDRDKLTAWLIASGRDAFINNWSTVPLKIAEWWFTSLSFLPNSPMATYIQGFLQLTDEQLTELVATCQPGTEPVVDPAPVEGPVLEPDTPL